VWSLEDPENWSVKGNIKRSSTRTLTFSVSPSSTENLSRPRIRPVILAIDIDEYGAVAEVFKQYLSDRVSITFLSEDWRRRLPIDKSDRFTPKPGIKIKCWRSI
jgi:hypothetical protein